MIFVRSSQLSIPEYLNTAIAWVGDRVWAAIQTVHHLPKKLVAVARLGVGDPSKNRQVRCALGWRTPA
jgi:hypothetical protein